ncbi:hypothetical protein ES707_22316 [subsurface metagenome]
MSNCPGAVLAVAVHDCVVGNVGVNHGSLDVGVAQDPLQHSQVTALSQKVPAKAVPEGIGAGLHPPDAGGRESPLHYLSYPPVG